MVSGFNGSCDQMIRFKNKGDCNAINKSKEIIWLKCTHHLEFFNQNTSAYRHGAWGRQRRGAVLHVAGAGVRGAGVGVPAAAGGGGVHGGGGGRGGKLRGRRLSPELGRSLRLDVLYPVGGFTRCLDSDNGFGNTTTPLPAPVLSTFIPSSSATLPCFCCTS
jgi:hypothetical protein